MIIIYEINKAIFYIVITLTIIKFSYSEVYRKWFGKILKTITSTIEWLINIICCGLILILKLICLILLVVSVYYFLESIMQLNSIKKMLENPTIKDTNSIILPYSNGIFFYFYSLIFKSILVLTKSITIKEPTLIIYLKIPIVYLYSIYINWLPIIYQKLEFKNVMNTFITICIYIFICILIKYFYYVRKSKCKA